MSGTDHFQPESPMAEDLDPMLIVLDGKSRVTLRTYEDVRRFLVPSGEERKRGLKGQVWLAVTDEEKRQAIAGFLKGADYAGLLVGTEPNP